MIRVRQIKVLVENDNLAYLYSHSDKNNNKIEERIDPQRSSGFTGLWYWREKSGDLCAGKADQAGFLRKPYRDVCTALSV